MFFPAEMLKLRAIVHGKALERFLEAFRGKKLIHFDSFEKNYENWKFTGTQNIEDVEGKIGAFNKITKLIGKFEKKPDYSRITESEKSVEDIESDVGKFYENVEELERKENEIKNLEEEILAHKRALGLLEKFKSEIGGHRFDNQVMYFGEIPEKEFKSLKISLKLNGLDRNFFNKMERRDGEEKRVILLFSREEDKRKIETMLEKYEFEKLVLPFDDKKISEILGIAEKSINDIEGKRKIREKELNEFANMHMKELKSYLLKVKSEIDKAKARNLFGKTEDVFLIEAYVKKRDRAEVERIAVESCGELIELGFSEPEQTNEMIPVVLENPKPFRSFELLTKMFSLPHYNEIDPTPFLAVTFMVFFGIMFADMFDGLLLLTIALYAKKAYKDSENIQNLCEILLYTSASSIFFGMLGGEFAGFAILDKAELMQPINLLTFSFALGLSQIFLGYFLGIINDLKNRNYFSLFANRISWLFITIGILGLVFYLPAIILAGIGGVLLVSLKGMREILEVTRIMSNFFSYARLLALNMAHVGVSTTFASLLRNLFTFSLAHSLLAFLLLLIIHLFFLFISVFAIFAHSLRLEYVEFFSKFYEGGGRLFNGF